MSPPNPAVDMKRDLQGIASDLKWSAVELAQIAERLERSGQQADAQALKRMIGIFQRGEAQLSGYVDELKSGRIQRPVSTLEN